MIKGKVSHKTIQKLFIGTLRLQNKETLVHNLI